MTDYNNTRFDFGEISKEISRLTPSVHPEKVLEKLIMAFENNEFMMGGKSQVTIMGGVRGIDGQIECDSTYLAETRDFEDYQSLYRIPTPLIKEFCQRRGYQIAPIYIQTLPLDRLQVDKGDMIELWPDKSAGEDGAKQISRLHNKTNASALNATGDFSSFRKTGAGATGQKQTMAQKDGRPSIAEIREIAREIYADALKKQEKPPNVTEAKSKITQIIRSRFTKPASHKGGETPIQKILDEKEFAEKRNPAGPQ